MASLVTCYLCDDISLYSNPENPQGPELLGEMKVGISSENVVDEAKESDCKGKTSFDLIETEDVDAEIEEIKKTNTTFIDPEECPTCLEEYDEENPKKITKYEHHFHLSCILEWMERSATCSVCNQRSFESHDTDKNKKRFNIGERDQTCC